MTNRKYSYAVGRRKMSTAVVKLFPNGKGTMNVVMDSKTVTLKEYFGGNVYLTEDSLYPFYIMSNDSMKKYDAEIVLKGGGIRGQAEALRLAFARALIEWSPEVRTQLKPFGLLKRDPRKKERKKPGLKKARKSPQWSKR